MAYSLVVLSSAQSEIESIVSYLVSLAGGPSVARLFLDELVSKFGLLRDNPCLFGLSRLSELRVLGYRVLFVKNYVVLYFFRDKRVSVAHMFHRRQDYAKLV